MELDDLKSTWQYVKPRIEILPSAEKTNIKIKKDMKSKLLRQSTVAILLLAICLALMATSRIWSLLTLPLWWIIALCSAIIFEMICLLYINRAIKGINLFEDTNSKIMKSTITIKKLYRNMELIIFIIVSSLLLWLSFTPLFINTWRMFFVWVLTITAFGAEYIYYKSYTNKLATLSNWDKE